MGVKWRAGPNVTLFALLAVAFAATSASAAPRRVSIVNLAADQAAGRRASDHVRGTLATVAPLQAVRTGNLSRAFEHALPKGSPVDAALAVATKALESAREARARFDDAAALAELARAERALLAMTTEPRARAMLATLNLQSARILSAKNPKRALLHFRLVRALDPKLTTLDPAKFAPSAIKLFKSAATPARSKAFARITASFDGATVFIDGKPRGKAPLSLELEPGIHYLAAQFPNQKSSGQRIVLQPNQRTAINLTLTPMSSEERARALRKAVVASPLPPGDTRYIETARAAASIAGVDAVVVIRTNPEGEVSVASFDARAGKLGRWHALDAPAKELFAVLLPVVVAPPPNGRGRRVIPPPPPPPVPWYKQRRYQFAIGGGVATVVGILAVVLTRGGEPQTVEGPTWGGF